MSARPKAKALKAASKAIKKKTAASSTKVKAVKKEQTLAVKSKARKVGKSLAAKGKRRVATARAKAQATTTTILQDASHIASQLAEQGKQILEAGQQKVVAEIGVLAKIARKGMRRAKGAL